MVKPSTSPLVDTELAARFSLGVIDLFQAKQSFVQIQTAARNAFHWAEYCLDLIEASSPLPQPPACRPSCDFCCYNQVELTAPEALLLGSFLAARFPPETLQLLLERVERSLVQRAGKTKAQMAAIRAELPCPLLTESRCLAYEVRPLMCRAMHSLDADDCRQEFAHPNLNLVKFYGSPPSHPCLPQPGPHRCLPGFGLSSRAFGPAPGHTGILLPIGSG